MGSTPAGQHLDAVGYEIRVRGHLGPHWTAWFDGARLPELPDGTTVLRGLVLDQSALHGVLQRLRDVGLTLVSVTQVPSHDAKPPHPE